MIGALLYLRLTSLWNRLVATLSRLRQPKYFAGALATAAYVYFFIIRQMGAPLRVLREVRVSGPAQPPPSHLSSAGSVAIASAVIFLLIIGRQALAWIAPPDQAGLRFSEAEIAFLFPAPLARRALVHFNLISSQLTIFFSSVLLTLLSNRWGSLGGNALIHAVGWWVILSALSLHSTGMGLAVARRTGGADRAPARPGDRARRARPDPRRRRLLRILSARPAAGARRNLGSLRPRALSRDPARYRTPALAAPAVPVDRGSVHGLHHEGLPPCARTGARVAGRALFLGRTPGGPLRGRIDRAGGKTGPVSRGTPRGDRDKIRPLPAQGAARSVPARGRPPARAGLPLEEPDRHPVLVQPARFSAHHRLRRRWWLRSICRPRGTPLRWRASPPCC